MATATPIIESDDPVIESGADKPFLLDDSAIWFVEQGSVDVFCVRRANDGRVLGRAHVVRVEAGHCLVGYPSDDIPAETSNGATSEPCAGAGEGASPRVGALQAVGRAGTRLRRLPIPDAADRLVDRSRIDETVRLIDGWVEGMYSGLVAGALPRDIQRLQPPARSRLSPGTKASTNDGVAWVTHTEGDSFLLGKVGLSMHGTPMPCSDRAWFESKTPSVVEVVGTHDVLERGDLWTSLEGFHRLVVECALLLMEERTATEVFRQRRRESERRKGLSEAFTDLVTLQEDSEKTVSLGAGARGCD